MISISLNSHLEIIKISLFTQRSSYRVTPSGFLRLPRPSSRPTSKEAETADLPVVSDGHALWFLGQWTKYRRRLRIEGLLNVDEFAPWTCGDSPQLNAMSLMDCDIRRVLLYLDPHRHDLWPTQPTSQFTVLEVFAQTIQYPEKRPTHLVSDSLEFLAALAQYSRIPRKA